MSGLGELLLEGASRMGIAMSGAQAEQFERYHRMLLEANARMNLTRVPEDLREAADRNYLDCIAPLAAGLPPAQTAADVGSGAGFPGIPLAIMLPGTRFTLMDALGKRVAFLEAVIAALGLDARAAHLRAEDAGRMPACRERFDLVTARAVAPLNVLCEYLLPLTRVGGMALALKGPGFEAELAEAEGALKLLGAGAVEARATDIPGRDWGHVAVWIEKAAPTPEKYPRRSGLARKRPL